MGNPKLWLCFRSVRLLFVLVIFIHQSLQAASVEEVALMNRADRQKVLIEGAKKEGKVSLYTTLIVDQVVRPVKEAFEKEYPFLQVEFFRGNAERLVQKMMAEYQAKRYEVDIIDGTVSPTMVRRANLLQRFYSPMLAEYPAELKDAQGYWGSTNLYFFATGYNSRMIKLNEAPKTYEDLLNPRWKGQMMWSTSRGSGAPMFIGNVLQTMGPEAGKGYLQKLKGQNVAKTTASNRQLLDLVIADEYPLALHIFNFIFLLSAKELSMSVLLVSPQTPVVSVAIFELWENAQVGELAAFGVLWTVILVSIAVVYYLFARRYGIQQT